MNNRKSSYQIGNQFNGNGDTVYVKADTIEVPPISQKNVQLMPDYSSHVLKAIGGNPNALNPDNVDVSMNKMLGATTSVNYVTLAKSEKDGNYTASIKVASSTGFIANSYPTNIKGKSNPTMGKLDYFAITKESNLSIREDCSVNATVIGTIGIGETFQGLQRMAKLWINMILMIIKNLSG